jgi:chromosome segregation ATPase
MPERQGIHIMSTIKTTNLERENLEAHVDLCAERYGQLESRLSTIESKVEEIHKDIQNSNQSMSKVIIGAATTILAGLLSLVVTILLKF